MPPEVLIIADDLTGALDSSVAFAGPERSVLVARHADAIPDLLDRRPNVLAVNTASRECAPETAAKRMTAALAALPLNDVPVIMKKVDSRLKGNIAAEMAILQNALGSRRVIAAPAIPTMGRCVRGGLLSGNGIAQPIAVAERLGVSAEIPDVANDRDMAAIVAQAGNDTLWVGARGLAFALAGEAGTVQTHRSRLAPPLMIVNGSRDPITLAQIERLGALTPLIEAPDGAVPLVRERSFAITISDGGGGEAGDVAGARFCASIDKLLHTYKPQSLLISGGESCNGILDRLAIRSLQVEAELRPGLPVSRAITPWGNLQLVTKSGGFGTPSLLAEILTETMADVSQ
ncbi:four-carbon acid sugar kinase family protein [Martelella endophytica]|uniref:Hrp-dependent type III effector protein n=1 Tax=Martelella endophytica TaxID=1486262 RepID=A0A0D5LRC1_MAREN|nr:four-carbon acid sugar kinase family protein [Martelella endophytica]AJY45868.1 hypothetical protein TM49_09585 [Martelella endophytica]